MEQKVYFQSCTTHNLALDHEFICFSRLTNTRIMILRIIVCLFLCYLTHTTSAFSYGWFLLPYCGIFVVSHFIVWFQLRKGSASYKQSLVINHGKPITNIISCTDEGLRSVNPDSGNVHNYAYGDVLRIAESKNMLIMRLKANLVVVMDRHNLTGGTEEEFVRFLRSRCPSLKKRVQKETLGKVMAIFYALVMTVIILIGVFRLPVLSDFSDKLAGRIPDSASYSEIASELEALGITGCSDTLLRQLEEDSQDYPSYYNNSYFKTLDLLCWLGYGEFNNVTWEWTPSQNGVYWFDAEVFGIETMYTDFLTGVSALDGELDFQVIEEWTENENLHTGTGDQFVRFLWNGKEYVLKGELDYDWFDLKAAKDLNTIIQDADTGKQLYFAYDGGQGVLVFYRDAQWAREFRQKTGITLSTDPNSIY